MNFIYNKIFYICFYLQDFIMYNYSSNKLMLRFQLRLSYFVKSIRDWSYEKQYGRKVF